MLYSKKIKSIVTWRVPVDRIYILKNYALNALDFILSNFLICVNIINKKQFAVTGSVNIHIAVSVKLLLYNYI